MREIKFRGQTANGEWVYGSLVHSKNIQPAIYFEVGKGSVKTFDFVYVRPETVGQFTGIHDSTTWKELTEQERKDWTMKGYMPSEWRGRKVYEGDVVKWENKRIGSYLAGKICFMESEWQVRGHSVSRLNLFRGLCELIGNIHDNPELLEATE